jgi:hypothetical protein
MDRKLKNVQAAQDIKGVAFEIRLGETGHGAEELKGG